VLSLVAALVLSVPEVPPECRAPPARELAALTAFAQSSGSLSVGLDSVATWCFDSGGTWTGGQGAPKGKRASPSPEPTGDCAKAIVACEAAKASLSPDARTLLLDTLADLEEPFLGVKYQPKRSGLAERPAEAADCAARDRSTLFSQAQARMDLARLASLAQNEYASYRTWLFAEGLKCAQAVARGEKDLTRRGIGVDQPVQGGGTQQVPSPRSPSGERLAVKGDAGSAGDVVPSTPSASGDLELRDAGVGVDAGVHARPVAPGAGPGPSATALSPARSPAEERGVPLGGPTAEREQALAAPLLDKWRYFLAEQVKLEQDPDWSAGFLASRELRDCHCQRLVPGDVVRRLENKDRVAPLEADDEKNTRCQLCLLDAYAPWRQRATRQCALALELGEFELGYLQRSDDGNGIPPRCLDAARAKAASGAPKPPTAVVSSGTPPATDTAPRGSGAFIITRAPAALPPTQGDFVKPTDYAPMPARENGRVYVRIFTSSACIAEVFPGPLQARTGDLLPLPIGIKEVVIRGPCGGFAEVYLGKEERPRVSESFARDNVALRLKLAP
jgi:hypothetical protein